MLETVNLPDKDIAPYVPVAGETAVEDLKSLAQAVRGMRVAHVNATSYGGGVSELLRSVVPLYRTLGVQATWLTIPGPNRFFEVTKGIHNALQGGDFDLTRERRDIYLEHTEEIAAQFNVDYDAVIVHDPQPAALLQSHNKDHAKWVWRCHIDTSDAGPEVLEFLGPLLAGYDAMVFTMDKFVPPAFRNGVPISISPPGIDPLSPKNMELPEASCAQIVAWSGIRLDRPLVTQISRFDPWKDPLGVIDVFREVRKRVPGTQLALLGQMALDDPEGWDMYHEVNARAEHDPDIHILTNFTGIGNSEVNAFQRRSNVVIQKSIREGFGLVVSEALWKGTPVVARRAGGIPMQMPDGAGGYLADDDTTVAEKTALLLESPGQARELGATGRETVRQRFLITRMLADELRLLKSLS